MGKKQKKASKAALCVFGRAGWKEIEGYLNILDSSIKQSNFPLYVYFCIGLEYT